MKQLTQLINYLQQQRCSTGGCPWTKQQTIASLLSHSLDEIYELAEAISNKDQAAIRDELADLLYHILFYAQIGSETDEFDIESLAAHALEKQQRRNPPNISADTTAADVNRHWHQQKQQEQDQNSSLLAKVPEKLPALLKAYKLQRLAASVGFDWENPQQVMAKLEEEVHELKHEINESAPLDRLTDEIGDLLFSTVNLARFLKIEPEIALRHTNNKFMQRFAYIEKQLAKTNRDINSTSLTELEKLWQESKLQ